MNSKDAEATNELIENNKNLMVALEKAEFKCKMLEEKIEKMKQYKRIVKSSRAIQCNNCSRYISCNIFIQHLSECNMTNSQANMSVVVNPNPSNSPYLLDPNSLDININQTIVKESADSRPYTEYLIQVTHKGKRWSVSRKYKEFCELHQRLNAEYPSTKFPDSSYIVLGGIGNLSSSKRPTVIEDRRKALQQYLKDLSMMEKIANSTYFLQFLELSKNLTAEEDESVILSTPNMASSKGYYSKMDQSGQKNVLPKAKSEEANEYDTEQDQERSNSMLMNKKQSDQSPNTETKLWGQSANKENSAQK